MAINKASGMNVVPRIDLINPGSATNIAREHDPFKPMCVCVDTSSKNWVEDKAQVTTNDADTPIDGLVIYESSGYGEPWIRKDATEWSKHWSVTNADGSPGTNPTTPDGNLTATHIFPNFDYRQFA